MVSLFLPNSDDQRVSVEKKQVHAHSVCHVGGSFRKLPSHKKLFRLAAEFPSSTKIKEVEMLAKTAPFLVVAAILFDSGLFLLL